MSLNCIVDPAVPHMEPFVENKMPYMYVNNVKEHSDPVILLRSVIGMMRFMIKHCSSNNSENFGENIDMVYTIHPQVYQKKYICSFHFSRGP